MVVLELDPTAAVGNDLAKEIRAVVRGFEENAGRTVQLRDNHPLRSADDECPLIRHQGNLAEEYFLLLDVPDRLLPGRLVLLKHGQLEGNFQRRRIVHSALLALVHLVLQLEADRVTAFLAERDSIGR